MTDVELPENATPGQGEYTAPASKSEHLLGQYTEPVTVADTETVSDETESLGKEDIPAVVNGNDND